VKKWLSRLVPLLVLAGLGIWGWTVFFPGPEQVIRKRLKDLARTASFTGKEGNFAKLASVQSLTSYCTPDVEITVDVPGHSRQTITGHGELLQVAGAARVYTGGFSVQFFDILVDVAPDKRSAVAELTARASVPREHDFYVQELKFTLKKMGGHWLVYRAETVKTLSP
jgi:hypothetical protein